MNTTRRHIHYWLAPTIVTLVFIFIYFYNWWGLSEVLAPRFNREFGIVENLQLAILVAIGIKAVKCFKYAQLTILKWLFAIVVLGTIVLFLEEIDYGLHFFDLAAGKSQTDILVERQQHNTIRNIHNQGSLTSVLKMTGYVVIAILFVIIPLLSQKLFRKDALIHLLLPSKWMIATIAAMFICNQVALYLSNSLTLINDSLSGNFSEFEETFTYYIFWLYITELLNTFRAAQANSYTSK